MKTIKLTFPGCLVLMSRTQPVRARAKKQLTPVGLTFYKGLGYSAITFGAGLGATYHKPLQKNLVSIGKAGLNYYKADFYSVGSGFGYTGNATTMYPGQFYSTFNESAVTGLRLPLTVGLRQDLPGVAKGAHAHAGPGTEVGIHNAHTSFLFLPSVGYMVPLPKGNYPDITRSLPTGFETGSTLISLGAALSLPR